MQSGYSLQKLQDAYKSFQIEPASPLSIQPEQLETAEGIALHLLSLTDFLREILERLEALENRHG